MQSGRNLLLASSGAAALLIAGMASAAETVTYGYDALGRLIVTTVSGGPNNNVGSATCFDRAGNRTRYTVGAGVSTCGTGASSSAASTLQPNADPGRQPDALASSPAQ